MIRRFSWGIAALLAACAGADPDPPDARDGGPARDAGMVAASVEVGAGQDAFESLSPGAMLTIERGPQAAGDARYNGFHVWLGVRARGIDPTDATIRLTVSAGGAELASGAYQNALVQESGDWVLYGQRMILSDCCAAENADVELAVELTDGAGWTGTDARTVVGGECIRGLPNPTVDPCP